MEAEPLGAPRGLCLLRKGKLASKPRTRSAEPRPEGRVCARARSATAAALGGGGGGGGRAAGRLSASAPCPRYAQTHSNHVFYKVERRLGAWPGVLILSLGRGRCLEGGRARDAGCLSWVEAGERRCEPGLGPAAAPRCAAPGAPVPLRAALWAAPAAQWGRSGCRERGRGKRAGGREAARRGVWMCVRPRGPARSQLLPECERAPEGAGRAGGGLLVTRPASVSLLTFAHTRSFP